VCTLTKFHVKLRLENIHNCEVLKCLILEVTALRKEIMIHRVIKLCLLGMMLRNSYNIYQINESV